MAATFGSPRSASAKQIPPVQLLLLCGDQEKKGVLQGPAAKAKANEEHNKRKKRRKKIATSGECGPLCG